MALFDFDKTKRIALWQELTNLLEEYYSNTASLKVSPSLDHQKIVELAGNYSFNKAVEPSEAIKHVIEGIKKYGVQISHPSYFGLFNPRANFAGIMADMITATLNPQIAAWSHAPFAAECESYLIQKFGEKFGFPSEAIDGIFCNGGAEANHTAVLCAINNALPQYAKQGLKASKKELVVYCSAESHHSIGKAAMMTGIGLDNVKTIPVDKTQRMRTDLLELQIVEDIKNGLHPIMVVATAGTTGTGAIDPILETAAIAENFGLWFHADAAYGGGAILDPEIKHVLNGIELSHSITFDMHKWMSVPMGTSVFLTRKTEILFRAFRIKTDYMPKEAEMLKITDPFSHSIQWSRRFIGLRTYLSMLIFGWDGYTETINHQVIIGQYLKKKLVDSGWKLMNNTELPVVCFTLPELEKDDAFVNTICDKVLKSGEAWISVYRINGVNTLRACITNYATTSKEIDDFVSLIDKFRVEILKQ